MKVRPFREKDVSLFYAIARLRISPPCTSRSVSQSSCDIPFHTKGICQIPCPAFSVGAILATVFNVAHQALGQPSLRARRKCDKVILFGYLASTRSAEMCHLSHSFSGLLLAALIHFENSWEDRKARHS